MDVAPSDNIAENGTVSWDAVRSGSLVATVTTIPSVANQAMLNVPVMTSAVVSLGPFVPRRI